MALIKTQSPDGAETEVRGMYARQQAEQGYVPNYAKVFCYRPDVLGLWRDLQANLHQHLAPREYELAAFGAGHAVKSSITTLIHGQALTEFLSESEIISLTGSLAQSPVADQDKVIVEYARKVALEAHAMSAEDIAALRHQGYSDATVFDIAAVAAAHCFFARLLDATGVEPDHAFMELNEPLRTALVVGRPISSRPDEYLRQA